MSVVKNVPHKLNQDTVGSLLVDGNSLTLLNVEEVARHNRHVALSPAAKEKIHQSRAVVEEILRRKDIVYGITTGFGKYKDVYVAPEDSEKLQHNYMLSHAVGVGKELDSITVRAIMLLRANALAKGFSGVREIVVQMLLDMINKGVHPLVPEQGSLGASGDLAPLAHLSLVLMGLGQAEFKSGRMTGAEALKMAGLSPLTLKAKEALALTNGTQMMGAIGASVVLEAQRLAKIADIIGAMSLEAQLGSKKAFDQLIQDTRPHPGQRASATNLRKLLEDSPLMESHANCGMVQDAYSLRCMPQVHGASRHAFQHARAVLEIEINSATDNPLIFSDKVLSGGNFHGQPLALVMDYTAIALSELANISERRTERLVNPQLSNGLPMFLVLNGGLNSGFMVAQYTAAALVSENKSLAHPASVDSIPTSANQEDHVSMGAISCRKSRMILENARKVLAIELLCAAQALDIRTGLHSGKKAAELPKACHQTFGLSPARAVKAAYDFVREHIPFLYEDRELHADIVKAEQLISSGMLCAAVEQVTGALG